MKRRMWRALAGSALLAVPIFPIPGLAGRSLSVGGVARTSTGGAIIAATENSASGDATRHVAIARLDTDGTVDLAYGTRGISSAGLAASARATAVAIDPATGEAWIGILTASGRSEIVALDGHGDRVRGFGSGGVGYLPPSFDGGPRALAWRPGALLVAAGRAPCAGCQAVVLDPSSGHAGSLWSFSGQGQCATRSITSAVFGPAGRAVLGTATASRPGCNAPLLTLDLSRNRGSLGIGAVPGASAVTVAGSGETACGGASLASRTALGPLTSFGPGRVPAAGGPAGRLVALTSLGGGACAALIYPRHAAHPIVVQTLAGGRPASAAALPGYVQPLGISRCNHHLLVIGDRLRAGVRSGLVAVVPVGAGPHVQAAVARTAAAMPSAATCRPA